MRKSPITLFGTCAIVLLSSLALTPAAQAAGGAVPGSKVCKDKENPPKDAVTKGGCIVADRRKGVCINCHQIAGAAQAGDVATRLENVAARFAGEDGKKRLRDQIYDARKANPNTVMPPFGPHAMLSNDEIDQVVEFLLTL
jgi:sulfur-oxidizing protein SoxX